MGIYDDLKVLFTKEGEFGKNPPWFVINRFLSFSSGTLAVSRNMDKYVFWLDKDLLALIFDALIPKQRTPWFKYIKKPKDEEFDLICKGLQRHYNWTNNDLKAMVPLINQICNDKEETKKILKFVGASKEEFAKRKIELADPQEDRLGAWFA